MCSVHHVRILNADRCVAVDCIICLQVMLSACSSYFEELLSQNPCQHPIVLMKDLKFWEVQALVDFMYRGEVNVGQDKLPSLLAAAEALQIKGQADKPLGYRVFHCGKVLGWGCECAPRHTSDEGQVYRMLHCGGLGFISVLHRKVAVFSASACTSSCKQSWEEMWNVSWQLCYLGASVFHD